MNSVDQFLNTSRYFLLSQNMVVHKNHLLLVQNRGDRQFVSISLQVSEKQSSLSETNPGAGHAGHRERDKAIPDRFILVQTCVHHYWR